MNLERVKEVLRRPLVMSTRGHVLTAVGMVRRRAQISKYLSAHPTERYLRIGAGKHTDAGWLATDLIPERWGVAYMDATKPFPLPSHTFDAIVCEHMIEHVAYSSAVRLFKECHRILKPEGVLRVATPNLRVMLELIDPDRANKDIDAYIRWSNETYGNRTVIPRTDNPAFVINRMMREWGHTFVYDEATLTDALIGAGFKKVKRVSFGISDHPALLGTDRHNEVIGDVFNEIESLVVEASGTS